MLLQKITLFRQDFISIISSSKALHSLFFSEPTQSDLHIQAAKQQIIGALPDGRTIQYIGKKKASGDGSCGFRAILGGKALQSKDDVFTRTGVISLFKDSLNDKTVIQLLAKDLEAKFKLMSNEYLPPFYDPFLGYTHSCKSPI